MNNLYIQIENGFPINHPAFENNLIQAFGVIPAHWQPFTRVQRPVPGIYQVLVSDESTYQQVDGVWQDTWQLRDMTPDEKVAKQQAAKDAWVALPNRDNFTAWIFDEATCSYVAPVSSPQDGNEYVWSGARNTWVIATK